MQADSSRYFNIFEVFIVVFVFMVSTLKDVLGVTSSIVAILQVSYVLL